jgi:hypothetical protein
MSNGSGSVVAIYRYPVKGLSADVRQPKSFQPPQSGTSISPLPSGMFSTRPLWVSMPKLWREAKSPSAMRC